MMVFVSFLAWVFILSSVFMIFYEPTKKDPTQNKYTHQTKQSGIPVRLNGKTYLYRLLNDSGEILYIGITNSPENRLLQHKETKLWFHQAVYVDLEIYETREEALLAERKAIRSERPLYNIQHNENGPALH
jgi:predicted GIY-YIG superfamily endonuclease